VADKTKKFARVANFSNTFYKKFVEGVSLYPENKNSESPYICQFLKVYFTEEL